jgi:hypothetical protein
VVNRECGLSLLSLDVENVVVWCEQSEPTYRGGEPGDENRVHTRGENSHMLACVACVFQNIERIETTHTRQKKEQHTLRIHTIRHIIYTM